MAFSFRLNTAKSSELEMDITGYFQLLAALSVMGAIIYAVKQFCNANSEQETDPTSDDIKTESVQEHPIGDLEKNLLDATHVEKRISRKHTEKFKKEPRKSKSKLTGIQSRTKFSNTNLEDRKLLIARDDLNRSLRTKQDKADAKKKFSDSFIGSTDSVPAAAIKSGRRRSTSKPPHEDSTPVNHPKRRSLPKVMSASEKITNTHRSPNKTGNCRPKDSNHDMIVPTTQLTDASVGKRQSAQMVYPYLFKRLVLVKKSTVGAANFQSKPEARGRSRKKVGKQDSSQTNAAMANMTSEPDLRNQEPAFSVNNVKEANWDANSTYRLQETDNSDLEVKTHAVRDTESNESYDCTILLPVQSKNFNLTSFTSEENVELCDVDKITRSLLPTNSAPSAARNASSVDTRRRKSFSPKVRDIPSKACLMKRNSDLPCGLRSNSFNMRKSFDAKCKLKVSSANVKRAFSVDAAPACETTGRKTSLLDLPEKLKECEGTQHTKLSKNIVLSLENNASRKRKEKQLHARMEGSCSNRGRSKSPEWPHDSTKTKSSAKKTQTNVKSHRKDNVSSLGQPVSSQKEGVILSIDKRQAIEAQHHMKNTISSKEKLQPTKKVDLRSTANRPEKRKDKQVNLQVESSYSNHGRQTSQEKTNIATKTKTSEKNQINHDTNRRQDIVSNLGRLSSAEKECGFHSIHKREIEARSQLKETISKQASFQIVTREDSSSKDMASSKKIENREKPHLERRCLNQGGPKTPEKQVEATKTKSSDRKQVINAKNHKNDSNVGRPKSARKESVFLAGEKRKA